jgi:hypothetical protein
LIDSAGKIVMDTVIVPDTAVQTDFATVMDIEAVKDTAAEAVVLVWEQKSLDYSN